MDQRPNVKSKPLKFLEENKWEKLQDIGFGNDFLNVAPKKEQTTEEKKTDKLDFMETIVHQKPLSTKWKGNPWNGKED